MSLEAALQENTAVMRELIARLTGASPTALQMTGAQLVDKVNADEKTTGAKVDEKKPATTQTAPETKAVTGALAAGSPSEPEAAAYDYEKDVRPILVKVSTSKGRDALIALLAKFDATKGDQIKPGQFGAVLTAANELLAA